MPRVAVRARRVDEARGQDIVVTAVDSDRAGETVIESSEVAGIARIFERGCLTDECSGLPRRAGAVDVLIMKGELWPGNVGRGAIHRSPYTTEPRFVVIDPLEYA